MRRRSLAAECVDGRRLDRGGCLESETLGSRWRSLNLCCQTRDAEDPKARAKVNAALFWFGYKLRAPAMQLFTRRIMLPVFVGKDGESADIVDGVAVPGLKAAFKVRGRGKVLFILLWVDLGRVSLLCEPVGHKNQRSPRCTPFTDNRNRILGGPGLCGRFGHLDCRLAVCL